MDDRLRKKHLSNTIKIMNSTHLKTINLIKNMSQKTDRQTDRQTDKTSMIAETDGEGGQNYYYSPQ